MSNESPDHFLNHLPETQWSVLEQMGREESNGMDWEANYSLAVVDYFRALGRTEEEALNSTREFFKQIFSEDDAVDELFVGAFRASLKQALKRFVSAEGNEGRFEAAERGFDRVWVISMMQKAVDTLCSEMEKAGEGRVFTLLAPMIDGRPLAMRRSEMAMQLEMSSSELTTAILKMGQRYRYFLEREIRHSVTTQEELETEVRELQTLWDS